jgi:hypothetical protein
VAQGGLAVACVIEASVAFSFPTDIYTRYFGILGAVHLMIAGGAVYRVNKGKWLWNLGEGLWRYRVGDYRIVAAIEDDRFLVLVVTVGRQREVYR